MELDKIERLLARYEEGETSLAEEKILRNYFLNNDVPEYLRSYQMIFTYANHQAQEKLRKEPEINPRKNWYAWSSVAAILILALGLFFFNDTSSRLNENDLGTITEEEVALEKARETLAMVSQIMNEGKSDLVYLKEFNKTTNKIIQID
ncbi:hypothetical protein [Christiangramia sabulilitoris]|uniref:Uncharacterized protein n=1 Tax=Christiangramia sabulilitoris TaxID=2583991 RepID=A0A550I6P9_9FLAO|nr:hypothetical protein [Christiangramia sabulilitoris]TRO66650.1 hypothetical protein FGM01_01835 [Christiangramia sabulilitoris]